MASGKWGVNTERRKENGTVPPPPTRTGRANCFYYHIYFAALSRFRRPTIHAVTGLYTRINGTPLQRPPKNGWWEGGEQWRMYGGSRGIGSPRLIVMIHIFSIKQPEGRIKIKM